MSESLRSNGRQADDHGSTKPYVIGFLLSLVFTIIPYYMVVNKTVGGKALLAIILGIAILQMLIQIIFFLHLGRGPKPFYNIAFFVSTVGIIMVVVGGSIFIINNLYSNMAPADASKKLVEKEGIYQIEGARTGACQGIHANHQITIEGGKFSPVYTEAKYCDTLTFINKDERVRVIAFGPHPDHDNYAGEYLLNVKKGRNKTVTLSDEGTYQYHDHLEPNVKGYFTVRP